MSSISTVSLTFLGLTSPCRTFLCSLFTILGKALSFLEAGYK